jgi:hypothetical protein
MRLARLPTDGGGVAQIKARSATVMDGVALTCAAGAATGDLHVGQKMATGDEPEQHDKKGHEKENPPHHVLPRRR